MKTIIKNGSFLAKMCIPLPLPKYKTYTYVCIVESEWAIKTFLRSKIIRKIYTKNVISKVNS